MIISHKHRFIFIHAGRTGGRSLTMALARHCGPEDVITPVRAAGFQGQNDEGFRRHDTGCDIRRRIGEQVWNEYFKFTIERNPWEKVLSRYSSVATRRKRSTLRGKYRHWTSGSLSFPIWFRMRVWIGRTLGRGRLRFSRHYPLYTEDGRVIVNFIGRHENRRAHLAMLSDRLMIHIDPDLRIGTRCGRDRRPYTEMYDPWMQEVMADHFRQDLELLGYRFGQPHPPEPLEFPCLGTKAAA